MSHVFLCHAFSDRAGTGNSVDAIVAELRDLGLETWIAPDNIGRDQHHATAISSAISSARAVLLLLSSASDGSRDVLTEISLARNHGIPIFVARLDEDCESSGGLAYYIHDLRPMTEWWRDNEFPRLVIDKLSATIDEPIDDPFEDQLYYDEDEQGEPEQNLPIAGDYSELSGYGGLNICVERYDAEQPLLIDVDGRRLIELSAIDVRGTGIQLALPQGPHHVVATIPSLGLGCSANVVTAADDEVVLTLSVRPNRHGVLRAIFDPIP